MLTLSDGLTPAALMEQAAAAEERGATGDLEAPHPALVIRGELLYRPRVISMLIESLD